jgi:hypothetical protein
VKKTQREKILDYMREWGSITPLDALREFGCMRLATRVFELKQQGYNIKTVIERAENKSGEPVHYARYFLKERDNV